MTAGGLPYVALPVVDVGIEVQVFGPIVVAGVLVGAEVMQRHAQRHGLTTSDFRLLLAWVLVSGFLGAHAFELLAYQRDQLAADGPVAFLKIWGGLSSFGGFLGGVIGQLLFLRRRALSPGVVFDTTGVGLLVAFTIGRVACTLVHDHVGVATDFVLGVDYPDPGGAGVLRAHHLGMYELAWLLPMTAVILGLAFRRRDRLAPGQLAVITTLCYAPVRFGLDFLRRHGTDPRYAGLTFAQWGAIAVFAAAVIIGLRSIRGPRRSRRGTSIARMGPPR